MTGIERYEQEQIDLERKNVELAGQKKLQGMRARLLFLEQEHGAVIQEIAALRNYLYPYNAYAQMLNRSGAEMQSQMLNRGTSGGFGLSGMFGDLFK